MPAVPNIEPPPASKLRRFLTSPSSVGSLTAATLAVYPKLLSHHSLRARLPDGAVVSALGGVSPRVYAIVIGFLLGYGMTKGVDWLRWKAIRSLFTYQGWVKDQKSTKTKLWALALKVLKGSGPFNTFQLQPLLPNQPIPPLEDTLNRWLTVAEQLLSPEEYEITKQCVEDFKTNEGPQLQEHLMKRYEDKVNWLADYWLSAAYLSSRNPIAVISNYYFQNAVEKNRSKDPLARATNMVYLTCRNAALLQQQRLPPVELQDLVPLCMHNYKFIFNTTRLPGEHMDTIAVHPGEKHIIVIRKGHYFKLNMYPTHNSSSELMTPQEIYQKLKEIREMADGLSDAERPLPVASLTTQRRDDWFRHRNQLKEKNSELLYAIDSSLFILVLDEYYPESDSAGAKRSLCGNGYNIWFDKSFNKVIYEDTSCGCNVEHSVIDATVMSSLAEHCLIGETYEYGQIPPSRNGPLKRLPCAERLHWDLSGMEDIVKNAYDKHMKVVDDMDLITLNSHYGKRYMKKARLSPDGYIQMALQLAYYRKHKEIVKTYEPSTGRMFALGRTETVHPVSAHSVAWVKAMDDPNINKEARTDLLRKAIKHQNTFRLDATVGKGCDRHLLGLYCASRELGMDIPKIFMDKPFNMPWKLSTSQVPTRMYEYELDLDYQRCAGGFGTPCPEGYGICYIHLGEDLINFHISSWKSCQETNSKELAQDIVDAMNDMRDVLGV